METPGKGITVSCDGDSIRTPRFDIANYQSLLNAPVRAAAAAERGRASSSAKSSGGWRYFVFFQFEKKHLRRVCAHHFTMFFL